jgi:hypothetical protein
MIPLAEQIAEAQRELALRRRCYPGWVKAGKLTQEDASRQLATMAAIVDSLKTLERLEVEQRQLSLFAVQA